jgi:hypothetical protein
MTTDADELPAFFPIIAHCPQRRLTLNSDNNSTATRIYRDKEQFHPHKTSKSRGWTDVLVQLNPHPGKNFPDITFRNFHRRQARRGSIFGAGSPSVART